MFTGIIESIGILKKIKKEGANIHFTIESEISKMLRVDQSVSHNGVCLTVIAAGETTHTVTAVAETLAKTDLKCWKENKRINLERALKAGDRLDGHIVQGHVDATGACIQRVSSNGSMLFTFSFPVSFAAFLIEKGSVCINGVSLTAFDLSTDRFSVTIIPYTLAHTTFEDMQEGDSVNLEFDVLGKYILRAGTLQQQPA